MAYGKKAKNSPPTTVRDGTRHAQLDSGNPAGRSQGVGARGSTKASAPAEDAPSLPVIDTTEQQTGRPRGSVIGP